MHDDLGLCSPTLQGADRLAQALCAVVLVPGFEGGGGGGRVVSGLEVEAVEAGESCPEVLVEGMLKRLGRMREEAGKRWGGVRGWGVFGLGWGGQVGVPLCGAGESEGQRW